MCKYNASHKTMITVINYRVDSLEVKEVWFLQRHGQPGTAFWAFLNALFFVNCVPNCCSSRSLLIFVMTSRPPKLAVAVTAIIL